MNNILRGTLFILSLTLIYSCGTTDPVPDDPNILGGNPNIPLGEVGNTFDISSVTIGNNTYNIDSSIEIVENEEGIATLHIKADFTEIPALKSLLSLLPESVKDTDGNLDGEFIFKITSEGIQDKTSFESLHTLAKYDAKTGDQYPLTTSNGTYTRTVTKISTTDDFQYGSILIKTIKIEQDSVIPGISKIEFHLNHKFGLVYFEVFMEDGSSAYVYLFPAIY